MLHFNIRIPTSCLFGCYVCAFINRELLPELKGFQRLNYTRAIPVVTRSFPKQALKHDKGIYIKEKWEGSLIRYRTLRWIWKASANDLLKFFIYCKQLALNSRGTIYVFCTPFAKFRASIRLSLYCYFFIYLIFNETVLQLQCYTNIKDETRSERSISAIARLVWPTSILEYKWFKR